MILYRKNLIRRPRVSGKVCEFSSAKVGARHTLKGACLALTHIADTLIPEQGKLLAWDRYGYAYNNPVIYNDPSGHWISGDYYDYACAETIYEKKDYILFLKVYPKLDHRLNPYFGSYPKDKLDLMTKNNIF